MHPSTAAAGCNCDNICSMHLSTAAAGCKCVQHAPLYCSCWSRAHALHVLVDTNVISPLSTSPVVRFLSVYSPMQWHSKEEWSDFRMLSKKVTSASIVVQIYSTAHLASSWHMTLRWNRKTCLLQSDRDTKQPRFQGELLPMGLAITSNNNCFVGGLSLLWEYLVMDMHRLQNMGKVKVVARESAEEVQKRAVPTLPLPDPKLPN